MEREIVMSTHLRYEMDFSIISWNVQFYPILQLAIQNGECFGGRVPVSKRRL